MIDREEMIKAVLRAEDGPGLKMAYGFLQGVSEDTEERQRSGSYKEPELDQRLRAVKGLLSIRDKKLFRRISVIIMDNAMEIGTSNEEGVE